MSSLLNQDLKARISNISINRGGNFDIGSPTSLLQMVGSVELGDLSAMVGDVGEAVSYSGGGTAGAVAASALVNNISKVNGGAETVDALGSTMGAVGSAAQTADTLTNLIQSGEAVKLASELATQLANDVSSYIGKKIGEATGKILSLPTPSDILGKGMSYMKEHIKSAGEIMQSLLKNTEDEQKDSQTSALTDRVNDIKDKATSKLGEISKTVSKYAKEVDKWSKEITAYVVEGPDWVEEKMQMYEDIAFSYIGKYVDGAVKFITDYKEETVNNLADGIAKKEAELVNKSLEKLIKKTLDKVTQAKQKVTNKAKAKVGAALLKLYASLGL